MKMYYGTRLSRNLIPFPYVSKSMEKNGLVITVLQDGGILVNGTCTTQTVFFLSTTIEWFTAYVYALVGRFAINNGLCLSLTANKSVSPSLPRVACENKRQLYLLFKQGDVHDNVVFYPMLNPGKTALPYERGSKNYPQRVKAIKRKLATKTVTVRNPKNLIPLPYSFADKTQDGIMRKKNQDGSITLTGTATVELYLTIARYKIGELPLGTYYSSGSNNNGSVMLAIDGYRDGKWAKSLSYGNKKFTVDFNGYDTLAIFVYIKKDTTVNYTIYPMLNEGPTAEPYFVEQDITYYYPVLCDIELPIDTQTNLITFPYHVSYISAKNIVFTIQDDGGIHVKGTVGSENEFINIDKKRGFALLNSATSPTDGKYYISSYTNLTSEQVRVLINQYGDVSVAVRANQGYVDGIVYPKLNRGNKPTPWYPRNEEVN